MSYIFLFVGQTGRIMTKPIYEDPIVAEIHAIRQSLLDDCGGDLDVYRWRARERQAASVRYIITTPLKKCTEQNDAPERRSQAS